ncbi:UPF0481 protein At3g47200-like isoform X2 [Juglans microcarpa x Juglans regia]|uniref:UPF0481 protein At3g47200-like isoform X2 n=1 Tax=Juglans microcarpa x Juglans regia TaxID=2249226 RepID=UPI001B7EF90D|nr:UPF0481 protein At3g47200-like isoform X2 [Juglans microcarpa x Juglans regia]
MGATPSASASDCPPEKSSPASNTSRQDDLMADSNRSKQTSIETEDVEEIASSIQGKLFETSPPPSQRSIFRVPNRLRRHNEKAFVPQLVSIGPFHFENKELKGMEKIKLWYLKCLLNRAPAEETISLVCLVKAVALGSTEQDCRKCYAEEVDVPRKKFIEMMILDGCFILEFLCRYQKDLMAIKGEEDLVPNTSWMPRKILADLLLLENQIPWCVLDCLFNLMPYLKTESCSRLDDLVSSPFSKYGMFPPSARSSTQNHKHLLDCFRNCLVGSCTITRPNCLVPLKRIPIRSVTQLCEKGFRFIAEDGENILNIKLEDNIIKMPALVIEENTESMFRNLIAYEHCDPSKGHEITSYAALLYCLIKSPTDALYLIERDIIQIGLSNEDIASFLNRLYNDIGCRGFLYTDLCERVNRPAPVISLPTVQLGIHAVRVRY